MYTYLFTYLPTYLITHHKCFLLSDTSSTAHMTSSRWAASQVLEPVRSVDSQATIGGKRIPSLARPNRYCTYWPGSRSLIISNKAVNTVLHLLSSNQSVLPICRMPAEYREVARARSFPPV